MTDDAPLLSRSYLNGALFVSLRYLTARAIAGVAGLDLHHLYRAMAWLGEELPEQEQDGRTPFAPRCRKDVVEEQLFAHRRDLLTRLDLVFLDTTRRYFAVAALVNVNAGGQSCRLPAHSLL